MQSILFEYLAIIALGVALFAGSSAPRPESPEAEVRSESAGKDLEDLTPAQRLKGD